VSRNKSLDVLLDFSYDRGVFESTSKIEGMAVSQKPDLFVDYYRTLSQNERPDMNRCLVLSLLGRHQETEKFAGIVAMLLSALAQRVDGTGLEAFQSELSQELKDPIKRKAWFEDSEDCKNFRLNWRYPLAIINVLEVLKAPGLSNIVKEMIDSAKSSMFRQRLGEILRAL
jgi:hypothetical protein